MARPTWAEMKTEATAMLRNRTDISSRIEVWIREAYQEIFYGFRFYETEASVTFTLASSTSSKLISAIAADIKHIFSLRDTTNGRKLRKSNFRWIDNRSTGVGAPTHYCRFATELLFDAAPTATTSYKLRYRKQITEPVFSGSTFPQTPSEWDEAIKMKAVSRGYNALLEPAMADQFESQALRIISMLPTDEVIDAEDDDFGVGVRQQ